MRWETDHPFDRGLYCERVDTVSYVESLERRVESQALYVAQLASEVVRLRSLNAELHAAAERLVEGLL